MAVNFDFSREGALRLLSVKGDERRRLFEEADEVRRRTFGDEVHIRGIVEFSNVCANNCLYCGLRVANRNIQRYCLDPDEVVEIARRMPERGQMTLVLQSGEAPSPQADRGLGELIQSVKRDTPLAVTVSVGNRPYEVYASWRACGMDRYLLRFETSDPALFGRVHPDCELRDRINCLRALQQLGVQTGSGFMIGLPGETLDLLADNIVLCREMHFDMIGIGPFVPNPDTPLGGASNAYADDPDMFFVALAVLRLFNPDAHIPATTAFDAVFPGIGRDLAMQRGANIFMPNNTPRRQRGEYLLYPNKPGVDDDPEDAVRSAVKRIKALGRTIGQGRGDSIREKKRETAT